MVKYIEKKRHHRKLFILLKIGNEKRISKIDMYPLYRTSGKEVFYAHFLKRNHSAQRASIKNILPPVYQIRLL